MIWTLTQIGLGGALGTVLRYLLVTAVAAPAGTLVVNIAGSLVMGLLFAGLVGRMQFAPVLMTGVLGGFTTYSACSLDALKLYEGGLVVQALVYIAASVLLSLLAVALGAALARGIMA